MFFQHFTNILIEIKHKGQFPRIWLADLCGIFDREHGSYPCPPRRLRNQTPGNFPLVSPPSMTLEWLQCFSGFPTEEQAAPVSCYISLLKPDTLPKKEEKSKLYSSILISTKNSYAKVKLIKLGLLGAQDHPGKKQYQTIQC